MYKNQTVDLCLIDTSGNEAFFDELKDLYINKCDCFILVYSITDKSTFEKMQQLKFEITSKLGT